MMGAQMNWRRRSVLLAGLLTLVGLALAGVWLLIPGVHSQASPSPAEAGQAGEPPRREADGDGEVPNISFIDSPSATCSRPVAGTDACYVNWNYLYVTASASQYIISMTVKLDGRQRASIGGFFQNYMYIPSDMFASGLRVACGPPGVDGLPDLGNQYSYTIRSRETGGLGAANYGSVTCPADVVTIAGVSLSGPSNGIRDVMYTFDAAALPITVTLPITYTWTATGQTTTTVTGGSFDAIAFSWPTDGDKQVSVTAENMSSSASASLTIRIQSHYQIYLPFVRR